MEEEFEGFISFGLDDNNFIIHPQFGSYNDRDNDIVVLEKDLPNDFLNDWDNNHWIIPCYQYINKNIIINNDAVIELEKNIKLAEIRERRENECFRIVNRGELWYENLTDEQLEELKDWYNKWLIVTDTEIIPNKPNFI